MSSQGTTPVKATLLRADSPDSEGGLYERLRHIIEGVTILAHSEEWGVTPCELDIEDPLPSVDPGHIRTIEGELHTHEGIVPCVIEVDGDPLIRLWTPPGFEDSYSI